MAALFWKMVRHLDELASAVGQAMGNDRLQLFRHVISAGRLPLDAFLQRVVIQPKRLGRAMDPVRLGHLHRRRPQRLRDARPRLTSPPPPLQPPPHPLQPRRKVRRPLATHQPSSTGFRAHGQPYHTPQKDSYTLAGRTRSKAVPKRNAPIRRWPVRPVRAAEKEQRSRRAGRGSSR